MSDEHLSVRDLQDTHLAVPGLSYREAAVAARHRRARYWPSLPSSRSPIFGLALPVLRSSGFWGFVLAVVTWPYSWSGFVGANIGLDPSWQAGLAMDAHFGIPFGTRALFTYGPLGFLILPGALYYPGLTLWATFFQLALATTFFGLLIYALRRLTWTPAAVAVAAVAGAPAVVIWWSSKLDFSEPLIGVGLFLVLELLRRDPDDPAGDLWWAGLGLLVGVMSLTKESAAVEIGVAALFALLVAPRRHKYRSTAISVSVCVVVFAAGWFGTGNGFDNLIAFAHGAAQITSGYTAAMYGPFVIYPSWQLWLVGLTAIGVGLLAWLSHPPVDLPGSGWRDWRGWLPLARCVATGLAITIVLFLLFKDGIVRQGLRIYFINLPLIVAAVLTRPLTRLRRVPDRAALVAAIVAAATLGWVTTGLPGQLFSPVSNTVNLAREVHVLTSPTLANRLVSQNRAAMRTTYGLPPAMLSTVSGSTVDVEPWEQKLAYAYPQMKWDSLPVLQDYSAYTPYLDHLDARYLASPDAPRFIIRIAGETVDDRVAQFDPPTTQIEIECRYHQVQTSPGWQLLERGSDRCGQPIPLGTVSTGFGHSISVPQTSDDRMVVAEFSIRQPLAWHLLTTFYRSPTVEVSLNGASSPNRFLVGTAPDEHLLQTPAKLVNGPGFEPEKITSFTLLNEHHSLTSDGIVVHFYAIPFH